MDTQFILKSQSVHSYRKTTLRKKKYVKHTLMCKHFQIFNWTKRKDWYTIIYENN